MTSTSHVLGVVNQQDALGWKQTWMQPSYSACNFVFTANLAHNKISNFNIKFSVSTKLLLSAFYGILQEMIIQL